MTTIQGLIAAKRAKIEAKLAGESDLTDAIVDKLGKLKLAGESATSSNGVAVDPVSIATGIGAASEINSIKASLIAILGELVNSKAFADLLVQDTAGSYFIRREVVDQTAGGPPLVQVERLDGTAGSPVGVLIPIKQSQSDSILEDKYYARVAGGGFAAGDSLSNVRVVNGETKAVTSLGWFNISTQQVLSAAPAPAAIKGYEDLIEELLAKIVAVLPASLGIKTAANSLPVVLPTDGVLPLPTGAATGQSQSDQLIILNAIDTAIANLGTESTLLDLEVLLASIRNNTLNPDIRPLTDTDVVSVVLPAGIQPKLDEIALKLPATLGAKAAAGSLSVTLSTDGVVPLPGGASTDRLQTELNQAIGIFGDNTIPADEGVDSTLGGLLRLIAQRMAIGDLATIESIGEVNNSDIALTPGDYANLKALIRGWWIDTQAMLGDTGDTSIASSAAPGTIKGLLRAIAQSQIDGAQLVVANLTGGDVATNTGASNITTIRTVSASDSPEVIKLTDRTQKTQISNGTIEASVVAASVVPAATNPALVVGVRPDSTIGVSSLPGTVAVDITAILAKLSADPATQTTASAILAALNTGTTHTDLAGMQATLAAMLAEMRDDVFVTSTLWEDRSTTVAVFYREERNRSQDDGTVATVYTRLSDNTIVGTMPAGVIPVQGAADRKIEFYRWRMRAAGTGYSAGDWTSNSIVFDTDGNGAVLSSTWYNLSTSNAIGAPLPADLEDPSDRLLAQVGDKVDVAATSDTGSFSLIALIKRSLANWTALLTRIPIQGQALAAASTPVVLPVAQLDTLTPPSNIGYALDTSISTLTKEGAVVTGETIPTGSGFLGWTSWIAKNVVTILGSIGLPADTFAPSDAGVSSQIALLKRLNIKIQNGSQSLGSALSVALARKTTIDGFTTTSAVANLNLLDPTGAGSPTDIRDLLSGVCHISAPGGGTQIIYQGSVDAAFTNPINMDVWVNNATVTTGALSGIGGNTRHQLNLAEFNYFRVNATFTSVGVTAKLIANQVPFVSPRNNVSVNNAITISGTSQVAATLNTNTVLTDVGSSTIAASATTGSLTPAGGLSYQVEFDVTAITGADTVCNLAIQESYNSGTSWRTIYTFEPITQPKGARVYKSDLLPLTGNRIRYVQTITGTAPSITRSILRTQSNLAIATAIGTRESGGFNVLDLPIYGRTRRVLANNRTAAPLFLGVYAKNTALAAADRPINGQIYLIPASGLSLTAVADWGEHGTVLAPEFANAATPTQIRLGVSSTFAQMTIPIGLGTAPNELFSLFVESV